MAQRGGKERKTLTGKAKELLEAYKLRGKGMNTNAFFERYGKEFSRGSWRQWRCYVDGFAETWDRLEAANIVAVGDDYLVGDTGEILSPRLAAWLREYEQSGNRATACQIADVTTTELDDATASNPEFARRRKELEKLWDWDVEDTLRLEARAGKVNAQKVWLEAKVPEFARKVDINMHHKVELSFPAVEARKKQLVASMGEYKQLPESTEEEEIIDVD